MTRLRCGDLSLEGSSRAGEETWFRVQPPGIGLDVGRGPSRLVGVSRLFLSHGHLDHACGLPYLLSQRSMQGLGPAHVWCPAPMAEPLGALVRAAAALEQRPYECEIRPLEAGERVAAGGSFAVEAFATDHVVPSLGFHLIHFKRRLAEAYRDLAEEEIAALARRGETVSRIDEELWLSYCGDSGPGVFAGEPRIFEARVLLLECTFLGERMRGRSGSYGHIHLEDLVERRREFANRAVVLHHLSRRHRLAELRRRVEERLPDLAERIHILGEGDAEAEG